MSNIVAHINPKLWLSTLFASVLFFVFFSWEQHQATTLRLEMISRNYPASFALFFGGFVALNAAYYARRVPVPGGKMRVHFVALALLNLGIFSWLGGIAALGLWPAENSSALLIWAYYLGLPLGGIFFGLAAVRWPERALARWPRLVLWLAIGLVGLGLTLLALATAVPALLLTPIQTAAFQVGRIGLVTATTLLYIWAALRVWQEFWVEGTLFGQRLALALLLFAAAQGVQTIAHSALFHLSLPYTLHLAALLVAIWAILSTLRANNTLQVSSYFAITGSISIVGLSLILAELFIYFFRLQESRPLIAAILLFQGMVNFLLLYVIVAYLDRLIQKRTAAYQQEQRLRNDLIQMIVHDLKNPLTVVYSSISLLLKGHLGTLEPIQARVLQRAKTSNKQILEMIETLLDVERLEAGALKLEQEFIKSSAWLDTCLTDWEVVAAARNVNVASALGNNLPTLWGDRQLLQRVLDNLLSNALNFTPESASVEVTAFVQESWLMIQVADQGPGVPEGEQQRIFEKFARVEGGQRRGSGLGLAFCRMVAEAHQGRITVANRLGGGAVFTLSLPLEIPLSMSPAENCDLTCG